MTSHCLVVTGLLVEPTLLCSAWLGTVGSCWAGHYAYLCCDHLLHLGNVLSWNSPDLLLSHVMPMCQNNRPSVLYWAGCQKVQGHVPVRVPQLSVIYLSVQRHRKMDHVMCTCCYSICWDCALASLQYPAIHCPGSQKKFPTLPKSGIPGLYWESSRSKLILLMIGVIPQEPVPIISVPERRHSKERLLSKSSISRHVTPPSSSLAGPSVMAWRHFDISMWYIPVPSSVILPCTSMLISYPLRWSWNILVLTTPETHPRVSA